MNPKHNRNVFFNPTVAAEYDSYYQKEPGKTIDKIEKNSLAPYLNKLQKDNLLELGCGTGHWTEFFSEQRFRVTAIDNSEVMLEFVENVNQVINEIDRVLKPEGTLVLGCLNTLSELGKNKDHDPVFKHARFFTVEEIKQMLSRFGNPTISTGVYFSPGFELLDGTEEQETV